MYEYYKELYKRLNEIKNGPKCKDYEIHQFKLKHPGRFITPFLCPSQYECYDRSNCIYYPIIDLRIAEMKGNCKDQIRSTITWDYLGIIEYGSETRNFFITSQKVSGVRKDGIIEFHNTLAINLRWHVGDFVRKRGEKIGDIQYSQKMNFKRNISLNRYIVFEPSPEIKIRIREDENKDLRFYFPILPAKRVYLIDGDLDLKGIRNTTYLRMTHTNNEEFRRALRTF